MKRLIVVADDSLIVEAIRIGLRESGEFTLLASVPAFNASAQQILRSTPQVVLIDMEHSERAADLVRSIKAEAPTVAVIMLSLSMDPEWLDEIFDAGAAAVISKVTHPRSLGTLIRETVDGHVVHIPADAVRPASRGAKAFMGADRTDGAEATLTNRELEVLQLVAGGSSNREIARNLWVTEQTVKFHLANVYRKLDVGNRTQASHFAHVNGLVDPPKSTTQS